MMQNIQESAAGTYVQRIDPSQTALSRQVPLTMEQLGMETPKAVFAKKDFEKALRKVSCKVKK